MFTFRRQFGQSCMRYATTLSTSTLPEMEVYSRGYTNVSLGDRVKWSEGMYTVSATCRMAGLVLTGLQLAHPNHMCSFCKHLLLASSAGDTKADLSSI